MNGLDYCGNENCRALVTPNEFYCQKCLTEYGVSQMNFIDLAYDIGQITTEKNSAYGNSFEDIGPFLCILYPTGIKPEQYTDALLIARIFDKLKRIASQKKAFGENPYEDIAGYGLCGAMKERRVQKREKE